MKFISVIILIFSLISACSSTNNTQAKTANSASYTDTGIQNQSTVQGTIKDTYGELLLGATVKLLQNGELIAGALTDIDGKFKINSSIEGLCTLEVSYVGYETHTHEITLIYGKILNLGDELKPMEDNVKLLKPIIYIYPEETCEIEVKMPLDNGFSHSYPKYEDKWIVTADSLGNLYDSTTRRSYYGLYWEAEGTFDFTLNEGHVVAGENTISFLESALATLGLNEREANEFIVFWLPILEANPYNLIHFSSDEYEEMAPLKVTPKPDTEIRVMMVYQPLQHAIDFPIQDLNKLAKKRAGFTVVEWGGSLYKGHLSKN